MFDGYIRDHAHWTPRAPAVLTPARGWSYAEFNADIDRFGAALAALGIDRATGVVSVCFDHPHHTLLATAALARLGIASSPFNDPGADLRLIEREGAGADGQGPRLVMLDRAWFDAMAAAEPRPLPRLEYDPEAIGRVMLSSGTTRAPRRVAMTWRRIEAGTLANICSRGAGRHGVWASLTTVEAMQGYTLALAAWSLGAAVAAVRPADVPALMEAHPAGLIGCTPAHLTALLALLPGGFQPRPGWRITAGGSRLPGALAQETRLRLTPDVWVSYGATEAPLNAAGPAGGLEDDPGQVGVAAAGAVAEIVDDEGRPAPDGQSGEIRLMGPRVADGYLGDPEATAERFRDGWFYTRDVGRRLPDGRLVLEGRVDDRMNLGGLKFMPAVLEEAAFACPGVRDAAAFAVPDAAGVDQCWLAVATVPGFDRETLAPHLAQYPGLPPPRFAWVDQIPRNLVGKVERARLRDALIAATRGAG